MRRFTIMTAVSALALSIAAPALAQTPLATGGSVRGAIADGDETGPEDAFRYDSYTVSARAGQRLEAVMRSAAFDTYLEVYGPDQAAAPLFSDDDGLGEGTDSRLRFTTTQDGVYVLRARTLSGLEGGAYTLSLTERPQARPAPRPGRIRSGQSQRGQLTSNDPETDAGGNYDAFVVRARAGERLAIDLTSDAFDPVVRVGRMENGVFNELAMNDDGPDTGLNSRLVFTAPEAGEYVIRATALNNAGEGGYTLAVAEGPEPAPTQAIEIGATVEGELTAADGKSEAGRAADAYRFSGREGQRVRIDMSSPDFDTYLQLFDDNRLSLAEDDDGAAEGTNSRLTFTLPRTGAYIVEARAFSDETGGYELTISEIEPEKPPQALAFGETLQGEIGEGDPTDSEDRGFDTYALTGKAGQRIHGIMRSGDFDTLIQIGRPGGEFDVLAYDDDGLGEGTDSRLSYTLPEDGNYLLRALPFAAAGKGLYSLELVDRGPQPVPGSLLVGSTARGTLTEADATAEDNSFYDAYRVALKKDEKLLITMVSNEVDSFVVVGSDKDGVFEALASDDDSLSDTHSKLEWTAPADGTYEVRAGTFQQGQTGAYALNVEKQP
ncbi:PPC domain-containing protein [Brevundimonas sp. Root1423]|uniref:PPC domain-containing protein n=1 Tax=Brevundimonas sp. Root1423 TaxID=1736462 RepID=UPI0006FBC10D|nr:PPC domain-containing protein [Brevundimonas sp. Root1423]KQY96365.1 peptidase [Brevundimonas sp. Root1423]